MTDWLRRINRPYIIVLGDEPNRIRRRGWTWSRRRAERWLRREQQDMGAWNPRIERAHLIGPTSTEEAP